MYHNSKLVILSVLVFFLVGPSVALAFDWMAFPQGLPLVGDLVGVVISVDEQGLKLALSTGEVRQVAFGSQCQITLNGLPAEYGALSPIMQGCYIEAAVSMSAGQASTVQGFYYCVEAQITEVDGDKVFLRLLNNPNAETWAVWPAGAMLPQVGSIYLLQLDSTGGVKQCQLLTALEGEQYLLANNISRLVK